MICQDIQSVPFDNQFLQEIIQRSQNIIPYRQCSYVLSAHFMNQNGINPNHKVAIIPGSEFSSHGINTDKCGMQCANLTLYTVKSEPMLKQKLYLQCLIPGCNRTFRSCFKFFSHQRTHTGEKPFKCTYPQCKSSFTQKGSLKMHMDLHLDKKHF